MEDMVNISVGTAGIVGLLGYLVVFIGLILLMLVVMAMASVFIKKAKKNAEAVVEAPAVEEAVETVAPIEEDKQEGLHKNLKVKFILMVEL